MGKKFKILSIDGGGMRGVIPCRLLARLENDLKKREGADARLCDYFDLICGTSTGSILAIGLALGMSANDLLSFYEKYGEAIFPPDKRSWTKKFSNWLTGQSFYERTALRKALKEAYGKCTPDGDTRIGNAKTRLLVPAYNGETGEMYVFKTAHSSKLVRDYQVPALAVALSSSAAPMFFRPYSFVYAKKGTKDRCVFRHMVDGSIVANNPSFLGVAEAVKVVGVPLEEISLLSLGTGTIGFNIYLKKDRLAPHFWADPISSESTRLFNALAAVQARDVHEKICLLQQGLEEGEKKFDYIRVQHPFKKDDFIELDDARNESVLRMNIIAYQLYDQYGEDIYRLFLTEKKRDFVPFLQP